jgi:ELP3 family radical SAM enzyme/protein acetyltransferase
MPNLPFSSPELDRKMMLEDFLGQTTAVVETTKDGIDYEDYDISRPDLSADQWKIYPCETVPYTKIEEWFRDGSYQPYAKDDLYSLLFDVKTNMYPWIRTNRIVRDIPKGYIIASSDEPNTSQILLDDLKSRNIQCMCIRCREVKENTWDGQFITVVRHYKASDGDEYFISAESEDKKTLYGFIRLRLVTQSNPIFPELLGCGLIRELHVYSNMSSVSLNMKESVQHKGVGKLLVANAERISASNGYRRMAIIAGIGVQRYYEKLGYNIDETSGEFMLKYI